MLPNTAGGYVAVLFVAALVGVIVNAVWLQRERHPAPLFGAEPAPSSSPLAVVKPPAPPPAADGAPVAQPSRLDAPPMPVARPLDHAATGSAAPKKSDQITDLLRNVGASDGAKDLIAAQRALIKLGYDIEADGVLGADTERALRDFEKTHNLPLNSEITPRLIAKLNASAR
jgi:hypothetical protein